jgi:Fe-S cluster assembly protein SufD
MDEPKVIIKQKSDPEKPVGLWLGKQDIPLGNRKNLNNQRMSAWELYNSMPMPSRMDEAWRRIDLSQMPFERINQAHSTGILNKPEVKIIASNLPEVKDASLTNLMEAEIKYSGLVEKARAALIKPGMDKFAALSAAYANSGAFIYLPKNVQLEQPLRVTLTDSGDTLALFQHLIWLEKDSRVTLIVDYRTQGASARVQMNIGSIGIHVGENAALTIVELLPKGQKSWSIIHAWAQVDRAGLLEWITCSTGSRLLKEFIQIDLNNSEARANVSGLYITDENQQVEFDTRQNHHSPNTTSDLLYKGVLLDESRALFRGMIYVAPGAFKSDGYQANKSLILGPHAHADSIPGLEIMADDVRCSHGATIGKIDPEELFYLQTRGLNKLDARQLIVQGFLDPIVQKIPLEVDRLSLRKQIGIKMSSG